MTLTPIRKLAMASALPLALLLSAPAMAADPSANDVYAAARAGHVDQALTQMQQVLKDHPDSAKAHFVEAELLAKAGRTAEARTELAKAEQLKPGLPFVSTTSVAALKQQLSNHTSSTGTATRTEVVQRESHGFPWIPVIVIAGLVFLVIAFLRRRSQAEAYPAPQANPYNSNYGNGGPQGGPFGGGYQGGPGYGAPPPQQGGMGGGGIMSSLAGGAAAGAGFAAGSAAINHMFGDDKPKAVEHDAPAQVQDNRDVNQDMGGNDFGISDSGSWDDGGSSGGNDDW